MASKKRYSGIVNVDNFFQKRKGEGYYKIGQRYSSESEEAIKFYKSKNKLR